MAGAGEIDIGFVEKAIGYSLTSPYFPSKVGGRPAWLSFNLPSDADLACGKCGGPTTFLLQVYSPRDSEEAFHRTCFLFICRNVDCCQPNSSDNFRVFRSQLPQHNDIYGPDPPDDGEVVTVACPVPLCEVCGNPGRKRCSACHGANYCSKQHQQLHWKSGHKQQCKKDQEGQASPASEPGTGILFPEFEIVTEVESCASDEDEDDTGTATESDVQSSSASSTQAESLSERDLDTFAAKESANDRQLQKFKKTIARDPEFADQVLRHQIGGRPLWIAADHQAKESDIPHCQCGAPREFEFQVMPQLLSHLKVDSTGSSLDWGVLCVYTCSASCAIGLSYIPEFVWKQDVTE